MRAAVVESFEAAPRFGEIDAPLPEAGEVDLAVIAAALTPLAKGKAAGKHYSSVGEFPFVPGNDGVGTTADGRRVYFFTSRPKFGSMAERTVARADDVIPVPEALDDVQAAALANPGMSSWAALQYRARLMPGETVLVHGATGAAGRMAVQIAKILGAGRVIAAGRNVQVLAGLLNFGADETLTLLADEPAATDQFKALFARGVDVIVDYLCGAPTERLLNALVGHGRPGGEPRVRLVQVGTAAGPSLSVPGAALRSSGLEIMGSGFGSVPHADLLASVAGVLKAATTTDFGLQTEATPLEHVEQAWGKEGERRIVFTI